jgi:hypothetical protein
MLVDCGGAVVGGVVRVEEGVVESGLKFTCMQIS